MFNRCLGFLLCFSSRFLSSLSDPQRRAEMQPMVPDHKQTHKHQSVFIWCFSSWNFIILAEMIHFIYLVLKRLTANSCTNIWFKRWFDRFLWSSSVRLNVCEPFQRNVAAFKDFLLSETSLQVSSVVMIGVGFSSIDDNIPVAEVTVCCFCLTVWTTPFVTSQTALR